MTVTTEAQTAVRAHLASQTRAIHEALHGDPVLSRLTNPAITQGQYLAALRVLSLFYQSVERERLRHGCWPELSLAAECDALDRDISAQTGIAAHLVFANRFELLGGLYVAQGASFGRNLFHKNLETALPESPRFFVSQRLHKSTWRLLCDYLENCGQDARQLEDMQSGAMRSFHTVAQLSRAQRTPAEPIQA